jgi:hypothetical protein
VSGTLDSEVIEARLALQRRAVWTLESNWASLLQTAHALEFALQLLTRPELRVEARLALKSRGGRILRLPDGFLTILLLAQSIFLLLGGELLLPLLLFRLCFNLSLSRDSLFNVLAHAIQLATSSSRLWEQHGKIRDRVPRSWFEVLRTVQEGTP